MGRTGVLFGAFLLAASLGACSDGPDGKYTPEECAGFLLVANNNGNSGSEQRKAAVEYDTHCK